MGQNWDRDISEAEEALREDTRTAEDDCLVCECFCISLKDIRDFCIENPEAGLKGLQERLSLGTGCGTCLRRLDDWWLLSGSVEP